MSTKTDASNIQQMGTQAYSQLLPINKNPFCPNEEYVDYMLWLTGWIDGFQKDAIGLSADIGASMGEIFSRLDAIDHEGTPSF